jgi:signal transduction histidine kinase
VAALEVFDGPPSEGRALHARRWHDGGRFSVERSLEVAGRPWTLVVSGGETAHVAGSGAVVWLIMVGGVMLSVLLFAVTKGQVEGRAAAERRAEELRASEETLRAADRAKDEFLATVSHELRTPLNAIAGWASILRTRSVSPEVHGRAMSAIARNAAALTRLVDDLLDMSRAAAGHLTLRRQTVDVRTTLQAAIDALLPLASEAGIMLRLDLTDALGTMSADPGRLQQIVTNLVSNAIKFTGRGGEIVVRACREPGEVVLRVQDTGIGIDPAFMPFLFDRFRQGDSSSRREHGGLGLGLAIVQHLVQLHGGSIEASSPGVGHGATFVVRLPDGRGAGAERVTHAGGTAISPARQPAPGAP